MEIVNKEDFELIAELEKEWRQATKIVRGSIGDDLLWARVGAISGLDERFFFEIAQEISTDTYSLFFGNETPNEISRDKFVENGRTIYKAYKNGSETAQLIRALSSPR